MLFQAPLYIYEQRRGQLKDENNVYSLDSVQFARSRCGNEIVGVSWANLNTTLDEDIETGRCDDVSGGWGGKTTPCSME